MSIKSISSSAGSLSSSLIYRPNVYSTVITLYSVSDSSSQIVAKAMAFSQAYPRIKIYISIFTSPPFVSPTSLQ